MNGAERENGSRDLSNLFRHGDAALRKLVSWGTDDATSIELCAIALAHLAYTTDERIANALLGSILLNDNLAEALDGSL